MKQHTLCIALFMLFLFAGCIRHEVERGATCLRLGDYTTALRFFDRALEKNPANFEARVGKGKALLQRAADNPEDPVSWQEACRNFEAARTLRPQAGLETLLGQAWAELARRQLGHGDTIGALEALSRAIEYDPQSPAPLNTAGIIYFRMGELEKSRALFNKAYTLDHSNPAAVFNLGMISWNENDFITARDFWFKGLQLSSNDEEILYWFARAEKKIRDLKAGSAGISRGGQ